MAGPPGPGLALSADFLQEAQVEGDGVLDDAD